MVAVRLSVTLFSVASALLASGAVPVSDTVNGVFDPAFHTLQVQVKGDEMAPPVIMLDADDRITVSFDEISPERRYMRYELIHCDSRWRPDALVSPEYIDGFNEGLVEDYAFSQATLIQYVHYRITLPNADMRFTLSGNYLLRVYDESDPDRTLLQARFSVCEPAMRVSASVSSRTDVDYNESHQQLTIGVDTRNMAVNNVYNDVMVSVQQNGRIDNEAFLTRPMRVAGPMLWYEHQKPLLFDAGNEYRRMETVSVTYPGMGVESMSFSDPYYHATLYTDLPRSGSSYSYDSTQHGRFKIREFNSDDSDVEAEYVVTHFSLEIPEIDGADIFVDGDMTCRRFSPLSRMVYNRASGLYELSMLLKQGAYNYQYLAVPSMSMRGNTAIVEGNHYQTVNEYLVKVYLRQPGERYDRLVAVTSAFSGR